MRLALAAAMGFLGPLSPLISTQAQAQAQERAFVQLSTTRQQYFVQEPIAVQVRFGFAADFLQDNLIQQFRQPLDLPAQLRLAWLPDKAAAERPGVRSGLTVAINDHLAYAQTAPDRLLDGQRFRVFQMQHSILAERSGELIIPRPELHFAYANNFREDFILGRVPADRQDRAVLGKRLTLSIQELPEQGRPLAFNGAVGNFQISAEISPSDLSQGDSFQLLLEISGQGNFASLHAPQLPTARGLHSLGRKEERLPDGLRVTYELLAQDDTLAAVPKIPFAFFDPEPPGRYRSISTPAIPLQIRPGLAASKPGQGNKTQNTAEDDIKDIKSMDTQPKSAEQDDGPPAWLPGLLLALLLLPLLVWLGWRYLRR